MLHFDNLLRLYHNTKDAPYFFILEEEKLLKNKFWLFAFALFILFIFGVLLFRSFSTPTQWISPDQNLPIHHRVLLLPLDSRPPCQDFPQALGLLGNIAVTSPPAELMDIHLQPAKKEELLLWLENHAAEQDALIISTDILLHGGLVASRRISPEQLTPEYEEKARIQVDRIIERLWAIKIKYPHLKIYVFSIIPRQLVSGEPPASYYEPHLYHYSQYSDKVAQFGNPKDTQKLADWRSILPDDVLAQYHRLFARNMTLNERLIGETEKGLFTRLIIAQDDAQPFGIPNWYRIRTEQYANDKNLLNQSVFFTGGTDEIAQLLLTRFALEVSGRPFTVYPYFTDDESSHHIFPFMREALDTNTFEKLRILGVQIAPNPEDADLILAIHGGFPNLPYSKWKESAGQIKKWLDQKYPVAIVDVARNFQKDQTILPFLIRANAPLLQLNAYAGWNTASNSIGTALSQGILLELGEDGFTPPGTLPARRNEQARFLLERFLDDWAYQKEVQDRKNGWLNFVGINRYELGYQSEKIAKDIHHELEGQFADFYRRALYNMPYTFEAPEGQRQFLLGPIDFEVSFPWNRTFEIKLHITPKWQEQTKP